MDLNRDEGSLRIGGKMPDTRRGSRFKFLGCCMPKKEEEEEEEVPVAGFETPFMQGESIKGDGSSTFFILIWTL